MCQAPRPQTGGSTEQQVAVPGADWVCNNFWCGHTNYAFRRACQKCEAPKPRDGTELDTPVCQVGIQLH